MSLLVLTRAGPGCGLHPNREMFVLLAGDDGLGDGLYLVVSLSLSLQVGFTYLILLYKPPPKGTNRTFKSILMFSSFSKGKK